MNLSKRRINFCITKKCQDQKRKKYGKNEKKLLVKKRMERRWNLFFGQCRIQFTEQMGSYHSFWLTGFKCLFHWYFFDKCNNKINCVSSLLEWVSQCVHWNRASMQRQYVHHLSQKISINIKMEHCVFKFIYRYFCGCHREYDIMCLFQIILAPDRKEDAHTHARALIDTSIKRDEKRL